MLESVAAKPAALSLPGLVGVLCLALGALGGGCAGPSDDQEDAAPGHNLARAAGESEIAIFAGGCFWCVEADFDKVPGVLETTSGYTGGRVDEPTYEQVSAGGTGHLEAVRIVFDPDVVTYEALVRAFWRSVDPTDPGGQFCDRGESYTTAIFATSEAQRGAAETSKAAAADALEQPIVTPIREAGPFYPAEDYHQDFYKKSPVRYRVYRFGCGRDQRVQALWGADAAEKPYAAEKP